MMSQRIAVILGEEAPLRKESTESSTHTFILPLRLCIIICFRLLFEVQPGKGQVNVYYTGREGT